MHERDRPARIWPAPTSAWQIATAMASAHDPYSFTEKKRIRKSFAKRASVLQVPFLLETQLDVLPRVPAGSDAPPEARKNEGLQAAFTSIFPISSHSGNARLEFVELLAAARPPFDVVECQQRGLTFARAAARQGAPRSSWTGSAEGRRSRK